MERAELESILEKNITDGELAQPRPPEFFPERPMKVSEFHTFQEGGRPMSRKQANRIIELLEEISGKLEPKSPTSL